MSTASTVELDTLHKKELDLMVPITRGTPGDSALFSGPPKTPEQKVLNKRKSQYYSHVFDYRTNTGTAKERACAECMVEVHIKTNMIISDELPLISNLSNYFAERYNRDEKFITVILDHSKCMMYAGSFSSAYVLTISTAQSQMLPATNQRNTYVFQQYLKEQLKIEPERGVVKFQPIAEENFGTNSVTLSMKIEKIETILADEHTSIKRGDSRSGNKTPLGRKKSSLKPIKSMRNLRTTITPLKPAAQHTRESASDTPLIPPPISASDKDVKTEKIRKMGRRKSIIALFRH